MFRKIFGMALAAFALLALGNQLSAKEEDQLARVNWNININAFGGFYQPCYYYPYYCYPYPPPCAYPCLYPYWAW